MCNIFLSLYVPFIKLSLRHEIFVIYEITHTKSHSLINCLYKFPLESSISIIKIFVILKSVKHLNIMHYIMSHPV